MIENRLEKMENNKTAFVLHHYKEGVFDPKRGLVRFRERIGAQREGIRLKVLRWMAAAAVVALLIAAGTGLYQWRLNRWEEVSARAFVLPDQSVVRLQEGAVLTFQPRRFAKERTVRLNGTGYFEVAHNEANPFEVHSGAAKVKVLGTQFQFDASRNTVYVTEGRVLFSADEEGLELSRGAYAVLQDGRPVLSAPETPNPAAWATGRLQYNAVPLGTVLEELSSLFGRELGFESADEPSLTGEFALSDGLPRIISLIESALNVKVHE